MGVWEWNHGVMAAVQSLSGLWGGVLDGFFAACTFLGEAGFLVMLVAACYWCLDKGMGEYLLLSLSAAISANGVLKDWFRCPRPFLNPDFADLRFVRLEGPLVDTVHLLDSWSFPSGHSQCSASAASAFGFWTCRRWVWGAGAALTLLVMLSRVYLGVHYPTDTLAGAALGFLISWELWKVLKRFPERRLRVFGGVVVLTSLALVGAPAPDTVKAVGLGAGALLGLWLEGRYIRFRVEGDWGRRTLRLVLGLALLLGVKEGLGAALPQGHLFLWLRYAAVGLTATGVWPAVFTRLGL